MGPVADPPDIPATLDRLRLAARAAHATGDLPGAQAALEQALGLAPRDPALWTALAELLHAAGRDGEARGAVERALALAPQDPAAQNLAALIANALGDAAGAEALLRGLLARQPHHAAARANLASLLERSNRAAEAEREARDGLKVAPHEPLLNLVVAQCALRRRDLDACALYLGRIRDAGGLIPQHAAYLRARLLDAQDRPAEAFAAFEAANRLAAAHAARAGADPARYRAQLAAESRAFTPEWVAGWGALPDPEPLPFRPAFLVGFPRSGTTLLEQILDAHPGVAALEEQPFLEELLNALAGGYPQGLAALGAAERAALRARYAARVLGARPDAAGRVVLDKFPLASTKAGAIQRLFPEARFVFALRHPYDVVLSCVMQEFGPNDAMANLLTLDDAAALYGATMALWQRYAEALPLAVATVRYERLVEDLAGEVRPVLEHLGLPWDPQVERFAEHARGRGRIRTPSYAQVSEGLSTAARGRFERYAACFGPGVRARLDPWVQRWGYAG